MNRKMRKAISIIVASVMLLTSGILVSRKMTAEAGDVVLQQYDAEWRSYPYGDGNLGNSGCGAFAIINAVKYLTGNTIDIYEIADWGSANEYINGVGSAFTIAPNAASKFGSQYGFQLDTHYGFGGYVGNSYPSSEEVYKAGWDTLVAKLSAGETAVGLVHNHFIAIVDYDSATDRVLVYDPGASSKRETTKSGDWKTYNELNYWSEEGTTALKLRAYLTFYFATGVTAPAVTTTTTAFDGSTDAAGTYIVSADGSALNMRSKPSTSGTILTRIPDGSAVLVTASNGSWASVSYNGVSGYCSMDYLIPAGESEGSEATTTTTSQSNTTVATTVTTTTTTSTEALSEELAGQYVVSANGSYLNMRSGPNTSFKAVTQIPDESVVQVTVANSSWAAVKWNQFEGYCSMAYLKPYAEGTTESATTTTTTTTTSTIASTSEVSEKTTTTNITTTEAVTTTETSKSANNQAGAYSVKTDGAHLNLRASGSTSSEILAQIPNSSELFVISVSDGWAKVSWDSITGYCSANYLTKKVINADQSTQSITDVDSSYLTQYGDVNRNGTVEIADVVLLHKALTGAISLNRTAAANADCYNDSVLSIVDATVIIQAIINNCEMPIKPIA